MKYVVKLVNLDIDILYYVVELQDYKIIYINSNNN